MGRKLIAYYSRRGRNPVGGTLQNLTVGNTELATELIRVLTAPKWDAFIRVAEAGSFNKAPEEMYISTPAVIKQINLLEHSLDVKLFLRTHRGSFCWSCGPASRSDARISNSSWRPLRTPPERPGYPAQSGAKHRHRGGTLRPEFPGGSPLRRVGIDSDPIRCAVSIYHPLAFKTLLTMDDLHGEDFMPIRRGWNSYLDIMRDELWLLHSPVPTPPVQRFLDAVQTLYH